ncbi:MAG: DUF5615 family PIN-like protein [Ignavibacteria bacterium]|nr:DUF5615 family PIN-like protein [Ignavibacteria bacterium]MCC7158731.1 DUF5615 family PIN-like protein [Ignavibacteria bacterium]
MKFLVDVGVSNKVEEYLKSIGFDTSCIRHINARMNDLEIIQIASEENRIILTMDKDFGDLVFKSGKSHAGVLLLRLEDESSDNKVKIVRSIIENFSNELSNNFCVFHKGKLRIRKML